MCNHIFQPTESSWCGQTCVAMIAGVSLDESIEEFGGKKGSTRTKDVVAALRKLGVECGDPPLRRFTGDCFPTDTCICKLHFKWTKTTHWVVWHEGRFYDPSIHGDRTLDLRKIKYPPGVRVKSYLPIFMSKEASGHE